MNAVAKLASRAFDLPRIAAEAREVQLSLWNQQKTICPQLTSLNPIDLLEPSIALGMFGFEVITDKDLGEAHENGRRVHAAGLIDWTQRVVRISPLYSYEEQRFTAAHELAHAVLHPEANGVHRDRSVSGPLPRTDLRELEADTFAACFLMPERLVRRRFHECFGLDRFSWSDDTAYLLCFLTVDEAKAKYRTTRDVSYALTRAMAFGGPSFVPLHRYFRVSPTTMAIRLEELGLV